MYNVTLIEQSLYSNRVNKKVNINKVMGFKNTVSALNSMSTCTLQNISACHDIYYTRGNFEGLIFHGRQVCKDFCGFIFAGHQVEYSVS